MSKSRSDVDGSCARLVISLASRLPAPLARRSREPRRVRMTQSRYLPASNHRILVLFKKPGRYLPRSAFGQAIDYALSNWPFLGVYLEEGRI